MDDDSNSTSDPAVPATHYVSSWPTECTRDHTDEFRSIWRGPNTVDWTFSEWTVVAGGVAASLSFLLTAIGSLFGIGIAGGG